MVFRLNVLCCETKLCNEMLSEYHSKCQRSLLWVPQMVNRFFDLFGKEEPETTQSLPCVDSRPV